MKKTKLITILLMLTLLFCAFALTACGDNDNDDSKSDPVKLTAPTVTLDGDTATWTAVENADKYEIDINGSLSYLASSQTSKKLADGDVFKVRAIGDGKAYMTSDWSKIVTYTLEDNSNPDMPVYTVTWKSGSTVLEVDYNVPMGTIPTYNGATPTKAADARYSYNFIGWSPAVTEVMADVTYSAVFTEVTNSYKVVWKNGDAILETDTNVPYGTMPEYNGATPTKASNEQYSYTFSGWSPEVSVVTGDVTYRAQFTSSRRIYTVTFYSDDGVTVLARVSVSYGVAAAYSKPTPIKNATEYYVYTFDKWVTSLGGTQEASLSSIKSDLNVYASFTATVRTLNLSVITNNSNYGEVSTTEIKNIAYGSLVEINGNVLTVDGKSVTATPKISTPQYTYTFVRWDAPVTVVSNTIIKATFERTVNKYTVTWKNGDEILEIDEDVIYGLTPVYNGAIPTKPADAEFTYTFAGWSPAVAAVTGDVTYYATFTDATNKYTVTFYDDDGTTVLGVAVVEYGQSAVYPNALPTKLPPQNRPDIIYTFDKWVTVLGGTEEASLDNITENKSVYAKYSTTSRTYVVTFCDYDGTTISQINVAYGNAAIAPGDPEREGYRFDGWDKTFSNITGELTVKATYVQQFTVEFLDYDNSVIDIQLVDYNGNATAPENPTRNNYRFTGWNTVFNNVVHDLTVKAEYIRQYKVTFLDYDETVLKEVTVDAGSTAVAPNNPSKEGYTFDGWDKAFANVTSDITVTATYKVKTYTVKFVMPDGTSIGDAQIVEHGFSAISPEYPEFYLEGTGDYTEVYGFTRWNKSFNNVTDDLVIEALYESDYTKPVIIIEYSQERNGDAKLYIYNHESIKLNAIEFTINYSTNVGNISINSATVNSASPLWVEDSDGNNNQYVINNNENIFTFAWSDANGKQFDWCSKVITFNFSTDGAVVGEATFRIDGCSAIVSDSNGENLEKITLVVVYR